MTPSEIERELSDILNQVERDHRGPPSEYKYAAFHRGWNDAVERDRFYVPRVLQRLTWQNLGNRFGQTFVDQTTPEEAFQVLAGRYMTSPD